jgi:hypothetical protein
MECYGEIHIMSLTHHLTGLTMTLVRENGEHRVHCQRFNEFEKVKLSRTRKKAVKQFIDYFFAACSMLTDNKVKP